MAEAAESVILNLEEYDSSKFTNYLYDCYKVNSIVDVRFKGDSNFRVAVDEDCFNIDVSNDHTDMIKLLEAYPEDKMIRMMPETIHYNIHKYEKGFIEIEDFEIVSDLWKLHKWIKSIEIVSHNVLFKWFAPPPLEFQCLQLLDEDQLRSLPENVLKKLDGVREKKTPKVEGKPVENYLRKHFQTRSWVGIPGEPEDDDIPKLPQISADELEERSRRLREVIDESGDLDTLDVQGRLITQRLRSLPAFQRERMICHIDSLFNVHAPVSYPAPPPMLPDAEPWVLTHLIFAPALPNQNRPPLPTNYDRMNVSYNPPAYHLIYQ